MNIEEKIDKYLDERASRKQALKKLERTIKSAKTEDQINTAVKMIENYFNMYGAKFFSDFFNLVKFFSGDETAKTHKTKVYNKLLDQIKKLEHEGRISKKVSDMMMKNIIEDPSTYL